MLETIGFKLNGRPVRLKVDGERTLLRVLRTDLGLTGPKYGGGEGLCGACTVLADDAAVLSCQKKIKEVDHSVITPYVGGEFGGKSASRQALEAARLAKRTGKPVQVAWSRAAAVLKTATI